MFRRADKTQTEHRQLADEASIDMIISDKIKACQRENGRCMTSTSNNLRKMYGVEPVNRILSRLNRQRTRGNKYQEKESNEIMNLLSLLTKTKDGIRTQSSDFMSL